MSSTKTKPPLDANAVLNDAMSEAKLQADTFKSAALFGWTYYHTYDSRKSAEGFPDAVLVREGQLIIAEFKTQRGKLSRHQKLWLALFASVAYAVARASGRDDLVRVFLWRPSDLRSGRIDAILAAR